MSKGDLFVAAVIGFQTCATVSYVMDRSYLQAIVWGGVAVSNLAWLFVVRAG